VLRHRWVGAFGDPEARNRYHPTQKPTVLLRDILTRWAPEGGTVLDPYAGAGSTLLACEQTGRTAFVSELSPAYVDVIIARWEHLTGRTAEPAEVTREALEGP
jgi:site-specific DNA-methyltransferase (adenine-specific)